MVNSALYWGPKGRRKNTHYLRALDSCPHPVRYKDSYNIYVARPYSKKFCQHISLFIFKLMWRFGFCRKLKFLPDSLIDLQHNHSVILMSIIQQRQFTKNSYTGKDIICGGEQKKESFVELPGFFTN
jgi:hypothetical protein